MPQPLRILIDFVEAHNVGHVVEALRFAAGHRAANPDAHIGLILNAVSPVEMATWASTVDEVHTVPMYDGPAAMEKAAQAIPRDWDHILDNVRRHEPAHSSVVPGFADWWPIADAHLRASRSHGVCGIPPQPPGYVPHQQVRLDLPSDARAAAGARLSGTHHPRIALVPAGSSDRAWYPSAGGWTDVLAGIRQRWPDAEVHLVGKLADDGRTATSVAADDHARLLALPGVADAFDLPLAEQLALVEACDVFLSTHTGFGMAALAVGTPWATISGGRWPEYFFNGVPFHSVLPGEGFGGFSMYQAPPDREDDEGEGRRQLHVTRARIRQDLPAILDALQSLIEGRVDHDEAVADHFRRLSALLGPAPTSCSASTWCTPVRSGDVIAVTGAAG